MSLSDRIHKEVAGRYVIEALIGTGGMGVVYRAKHRRTGQRVAVKFLASGASEDLELRRRFAREARAAAQLEHPNIVRLYDFDDDPDMGYYMVLELLRGEPLEQRLSRVGCMTAQETLECLSPVMHALAHAHHRGVIHRDMKPSNVFLHRDSSGAEVPKLLDFGVARLLQLQSATATEPGVLLGTPTHMAPEQVDHRAPPSSATDVWGMAVTVYQCLTGALPFPSVRLEAALAAMNAGAHTPIGQHLPPELATPQLQGALDRALHPDPSQRTASMSALHRELCAALNVAIDLSFDSGFALFGRMIATDRALQGFLRDEGRVSPLSRSAKSPEERGTSEGCPKRAKPEFEVSASVDWPAAQGHADVDPTTPTSAGESEGLLGPQGLGAARTRELPPLGSELGSKELDVGSTAALRTLPQAVASAPGGGRQPRRAGRVLSRVAYALGCASLLVLGVLAGAVLHGLWSRWTVPPDVRSVSERPATAGVEVEPPAIDRAPEAHRASMPVQRDASVAPQAKPPAKKAEAKPTQRRPTRPMSGQEPLDIGDVLVPRAR